MDRAKIKQTILLDIEKTKLFIDECKILSQPVAPDCSIDHSLQMEALAENELTLKTLQKSELKLNQLNHVLLMVDSKLFGICQKCNSSIPLQRLMIRPESQFCVNCST
jgi:DnaK suppressor protein